MGDNNSFIKNVTFIETILSKRNLQLLYKPYGLLNIETSPLLGTLYCSCLKQQATAFHSNQEQSKGKIPQPKTYMMKIKIYVEKVFSFIFLNTWKMYRIRMTIHLISNLLKSFTTTQVCQKMLNDPWNSGVRKSFEELSSLLSGFLGPEPNLHNVFLNSHKEAYMEPSF